MLNNFEVDFLSHAIVCTVEFHAAYGLYQGLIIQLKLDIELFRLFIGDCDLLKWWCYMRLLCQPDI